MLRVTQILPDELCALDQPPADTEPAVPPPDPKPKGREIPSMCLAKRPAASSLAKPSRKTIRGQPRPLALAEISKSGNSASSNPVIRDEPPWDTFKKCYECDLAGTVAVCVRCSGRRTVWAIRQYPTRDADRILEILRSTCHKNVASAFECFRTSDALYTLSRFYPLTLEHIVACEAFPDEQQLAAIMSQVGPSVICRHRRSLIMHSFLVAYHISSPKISSTHP